MPSLSAPSHHHHHHHHAVPANRGSAATSVRVITVNGKQHIRPDAAISSANKAAGATTATRSSSSTAKKKSVSSSSSSRPECPICLELFHCPITTSCGHTFCFHCLFLSSPPIRECPMCRHGPLLVERGDFAEDPLMALRVKMERSIAAITTTVPRMAAAAADGRRGGGGGGGAPLPRIGAGANNNAYPNRVVAPPSPSSMALTTRKDHLEDPSVLLAKYKAAMGRWVAEEREKEKARGEQEMEMEVPHHHDHNQGEQPSLIASSPLYAAASLVARAYLGRRLQSHYTFDENEQQHMFHEGGYMWRRAPSLAVQLNDTRDNTDDGADNHGNGRREGGGGGRGAGADAAGVRRRAPAEHDGGAGAGNNGDHNGMDAHIEHLLRIEQEKREKLNNNGNQKRGTNSRDDTSARRKSISSASQQRMSSGGGGDADNSRRVAPIIPLPPSQQRPNPHHQHHHQVAAMPLPPITITPRGKMWATAAAVEGLGGYGNHQSALLATTAATGSSSSPSAAAAVITTVDVASIPKYQRQRPQSAAEQKEDAQLVADTRAYLKRMGGGGGGGVGVGVGGERPPLLPLRAR